MAEEFRQERKKISPSEFHQQLSERNEDNPMAKVQEAQKFAANEIGKDFNESPLSGHNPAIKMHGNMPPEFQEILKQQAAQLPPQPGQQVDAVRKKPIPGVLKTNEELEKCLARLKPLLKYDEIILPSKGKFYNNIPGVLHIRSMTGAEEEILATQRYVKKGQAIDMIFQNCIQEKIPINELLSIDRTYILIYLRGISYTEQYDVEIRCPECGAKFSTIINLDQDITVNPCPDDFGPENLQGILPESGFRFSYRLATGKDDAQVNAHREIKNKNFRDADDDSLSYRTALLLNNIEEVTELNDLQYLIKQLPISDVSYLRNEINNPPFGVNTEIEMLCNSCGAEFKIDLPLEASFFFPRKKTETVQ